ncbi:phage head-tail connector protein [Pseudobacillus badius]|uniref:phage head-tail connector protein n=1 Tax=Bacillus badius TaxID=1455 RepID=UPI0007B3B3B7|nr:phage head-tail connector protein [Bacillus badius]KZR58359.1 hypothetical protein A3781_17335 [Bacillus badius]
MSALLIELKERLRITWPDEDEHLTRLLEESKAYLSELTNASFDFEKEKRPKELLLERCRYAYNNAVDEFEMNFKQELSRFILHTALGKVGVLNGPESISGDI